MIVNNLFATPVVFFEIPDIVIKETLSIVNEYINTNTDWKQKVPCGETFTTYHYNKNFLADVGCNNLLNQINENIRHFLNLIGKSPTSDLEIENWLNFNPPGTGHQMHEHFNSIASGVIYLDADADTGDLVFHDPVALRVQANSFKPKSIIKRNEYNFINCGLKPQNNRMVVFEGWVYHSVEYNKTNKNRISISFNAEDING